MNTDPFTSWRYRICVRGRALPESAKVVVYAACMTAYIWLAAYIFYLWPWTNEWCWWYIPQACSILVVGSLWHHIIAQEVLGL